MFFIHEKLYKKIKLPINEQNIWKTEETAKTYKGSMKSFFVLSNCTKRLIKAIPNESNIPKSEKPTNRLNAKTIMSSALIRFCMDS